MVKKKSAERSLQGQVNKPAIKKRRYFVPGAGRSVEAGDLAGVKQALNKKAEVGDGNK